MGKNTQIRLKFDERKTLMPQNRHFSCRILIVIILSIIFYCVAWPATLWSSEKETSQDKQESKITWAEFYLESNSMQHEDYNLISDQFGKLGIHTFKIGDRDIDLYLKGRVYADKDRLYWNNRYELGLGSRYRPFSDLGLFLFIDILYGGYTGRENKDEPNPDDEPYLDVQGGLAFWSWWGKENWQIGEKIEFYLPLTGWRELYGDCIYYHHPDNLLIITTDYKEGLVLGNIGSIGFDSYIALEVDWDTKAYEWNNYFAAGIGFRIKPFKKLDLKVGVEYLWRHFYRGGYNDLEEYYTGFEFTLEFWKGW